MNNLCTRRLLVVCFFSLLLLPTTAVTAAGETDREADHDALRNLVKQYKAAIEKADPAALKPYLADDFSAVMVTGEAVDSFDSLSAYWSNVQRMIGEGGTYRVKVHVPELATLTGDWAISHGTTEDTVVTSDGKEFKFDGMWTAVCRRDADGWKMVRLHGSMDALNNTFVKAAAQAGSAKAAGLGGVVGFLVGAVLIWLLGRRRRGSSAA